jgi:hypothetical protein
MQHVTYVRRLRSPWQNHWAYGEEAGNEFGASAVDGRTTSGGPCWKKVTTSSKRAASWTPYLPMLLTCKRMFVTNLLFSPISPLACNPRNADAPRSFECLKSMYKSTTFVFTDTVAIQMFFGHCKEPFPTYNKIGPILSPPAFFLVHKKFGVVSQSRLCFRNSCVRERHGNTKRTTFVGYI